MNKETYILERKEKEKAFYSLRRQLAIHFSLVMDMKIDKDLTVNGILVQYRKQRFHIIGSWQEQAGFRNLIDVARELYRLGVRPKKKEEWSEHLCSKPESK